MEFNPDPTKQATEVKVNEQKHLGLFLEPGLSFEKHLSVKIIRAKRNIGILKHLFKFLPLKTLDQMYKVLVRSHLDYCDAIYHIPSILHQPPLGRTLDSLMEKVEIIQYQAALAITGAWQGSSRSRIYEELGWETFSDRRKCRRSLQVHKIITNSTPPYRKDKLPPNCRVMFSGNIRTTFHEIICKSNRYMNSFFPDTIVSWNIFMKIFQYKEVPSICILKKIFYLLFVLSLKSFFKIHDTVGLRYLFQLRVGLSPFRGHKCRHNFIDTPSGICHCNQGIEDTNHFLFSCPFFTNLRATLVTSINEILHRIYK